MIANKRKTMLENLNSMITNKIDESYQLDRMELAFKQHMVRQKSLELAIKNSLTGITNVLDAYPTKPPTTQ